MKQSRDGDKGNAFLSCGHFATDLAHLDELIDRRTKTLKLIDVRREQYTQRTGRDLTDDNVWVYQRRCEVASLDAIIDRVQQPDAADDDAAAAGGRAPPPCPDTAEHRPRQPRIGAA